jgi:hypothetical protein
VCWAAAIVAAGAVYMVLVHPKLMENSAKRQHRDLFFARMQKLDGAVGGVQNPSDTIRTYTEKQVRGDRSLNDSEKAYAELAKAYAERFPDKVFSLDVDKKIYMLYPLGNNSSKIPNDSDLKASKAKDEALAAERQKFVEAFKGLQFSVDKTLERDNKDFQPAPPRDNYLFIQWVMGNATQLGQDQKIDQMLEEKLGKGCMNFQRSEILQPGSPCEWKSDGRCSGYIEDKEEVRSLVLKRLVLRRLVLGAVARAAAPVQTVVGDDYEAGKKLKSRTDVRLRHVQFVDALEFLDGDARATDPNRAFVPARNMRFAAAGLQAPTAKDNPVPYKPHGFALKVKCHPAVVPSLLSELERIGKSDEGGEKQRPFACWVERVLIERAGRPEWSQTAPVVKPDRLPRDGGNRYHEWPVAVEILAVIPEFDEKLDPAP